MNQRFIWNFEFSTKIILPLSSFMEQPDIVKWEIRYFWPEDQIINLHKIDDALLDITCYQQKHKEDCYYLLPNENYNIKYRRNQLLYKPLVKHSNKALGYGTKINLDAVTDYPDQQQESIDHLQEILHQAQNFGKKINVQKTSFTYKFATTPHVKLELARLKVNDKVYFSACIEGKSLPLVETINKHLLDDQVSCEYVTFLKSIDKS
ncbi:hypothetical protein [Legionella fallonii]|nr:hypothetical protein [Legionella fallonii]